MPSTSRTKKTMFNLYAGIIYQVTSAILNFFVRRIFLQHISVYYLGLDGVFGNLINMLCLLDFGVGTAATYYLIRAAAHNDEEDLMLTYQVFVKLYRIVALILTVLGIVLCFNINWFVNTSGYDISVIKISFILIYLRTIFFFLMSCPKTVLLCNQQNYRNMIANTVMTVIFFAIKAVTISAFENFYVYLIVLFLEVVLNYLVIWKDFRKLYPTRYEFSDARRREKARAILEYGKRILLLNINSFVFNSTDNLVISKILGTITVGIMSNYYMIINAIQLFATQVIDAASASISNYINDEAVNDEKNTNLLLSNMGFVCFAMGVFCAVGLFGLTDEFINLFFGGQFVMPKAVILLFSLNVLCTLFQTALQVFVNGRGLAADEIGYAIAMSAVNLSVSIAGAMTIGVPGVLAGTIAANLIMIIGRTRILKKHLHINQSQFLRECLSYLIIALIDIAVIAFFFPKACPNLAAFIGRGFACLGLIVVSILCFAGTDRFKTSLALLRQFIHIKSTRKMS